MIIFTMGVKLMPNRIYPIQSPAQAASLWKLAAICGFVLFWFYGENEPTDLLLILSLSIMILARSRFVLPDATLLVDILLCTFFSFFWSGAWIGLALPMFEALYRRAHLYCIPIIVLPFLYWYVTPFFIAVMVQAALVGLFINRWEKQIHAYRHQVDEERRERYELMRLKEEWQMANVRAARIAELTERTRISHKLHDEVGHEISAAVIAMQAFEQLWKENDPQASSLLEQARKRLDNSAAQLRETVHNMTPIQQSGPARLEEICHQFTALPVQLRIFGDTDLIPAHLWTVLEPCLKEALTNTIRHSDASSVDATLDITPSIARLSIRDNGTMESAEDPGMGLRNLRRRAESVGGTVTAHFDLGFHLVCVLPLRKEII